MQTVTVGDLAARIRAAANLSGRRRTLFTFLVGAGFSVSAGMPRTSQLVRVMKRQLESGDLQPRPWRELLEEVAKESDVDLGEPAALAYQRLLNEPALFPFPPHRQRFITDVVRWAADRRIEMSPESLMLAALLNAGSDSAPADGGLSQWIAHTVYTTNFDEILPQTFRYCGEAVAVIDHPHAHGRAQGDAFYPRVVYLHGSHLYYDLRNTEQELTTADRDRSGGVDLTGLFQRFRDTLRSTGLIVLGYSGWQDRAMAAIRDALADRESLPFHLYWGAYPDVKSLSDETRAILEEHPGRAFVLEPGKTAADVLSLLAEQLGFKYEETQSRWSDRVNRLASHMDSFRKPSAAAVSTSATAPAAAEATRPQPTGPDPAWHLEAGRLFEHANRAQRELDVRVMKALRTAVEAHLAAADDASRNTPEYRRLIVTRAGLFDFGPVDDAIDVWRDAVEALRLGNDNVALAMALVGLTGVLLRANRNEEAMAAAREALSLASAAASEPVVVRSLLGVGRALLALGRTEEASALANAARQRAERAHLDNEVVSARSVLSSIELREGRFESARRLAGEVLEYRERFGPPGGLAFALQEAGTVEQHAGQLSRAATYLSRAESIFRESHFTRGLAYLIARLGNVLVRRGDPAGWSRIEEGMTLLEAEPVRDRAVGYSMALPLLIQRSELARAERLLDQLEDADVAGWVRAGNLRHRASIASRRDQEKLSDELSSRAEELCVHIGDASELARTLLHWAGNIFPFGRLAEAKNLVLRALEILRSLGNDPGLYVATARLSQVLAAEGQVAAAERKLETLSGYDPGDDAVGLGIGDLARGIVAAARERLDDAEQHLAAADAHFARVEAYYSRGRVTIERAHIARLRGDALRAARLLRELANDAKARGELLLHRLAIEEPQR